VECLVDFSVSNLNWLREEEGFGQNAMQRRLHQAELDKLADPSLDPRDIDEDIAYARDGIAFPPVEDANGDVNENGDTHDLDAHNGVDSYYADPIANGDIPRLGQKRGRDDEDDEGNKRRKKKAKKAKKQDDSARPLQPKKLSGKQYQKEVQRKLLEEAKRDDRLILVAARMKNKSKIVKLSLSTGKLECIYGTDLFLNVHRRIFVFGFAGRLFLRSLYSRARSMSFSRLGRAVPPRKPGGSSVGISSSP
jgi:hypothetical protein